VNNYYAISKRIEGFNDYFLKNKIKNECMTLSIDNLNDAAYTKEKINSFLEQHDSIKGIFVPSSRISILVEAIKDSSLKKCKLIGFDNTEQNIQCLENDSVSFLISQKPFEQGYESIRIMTDFLVKHKKPAGKIYSPIDILTKENARYNERNEREFQHNDH
jgi:LacI family transcriptional regulator